MLGQIGARQPHVDHIHPKPRRFGPRIVTDLVHQRGTVFRQHVLAVHTTQNLTDFGVDDHVKVAARSFNATRTNCTPERFQINDPPARKRIDHQAAIIQRCDLQRLGR